MRNELAQNISRIIEPLQDYVRRILENDQPSEREDQLQEGAQFVAGRLLDGRDAKLTFICTHNSRRSHLSHVWAEVAARFYGLDRVQTFSGGTEATACNPRTVQAFVRAGFSVEIPDGGQENPRIKVHHATDGEPIVCFSKIYVEPGNPSSDYAAMMCCSDVDEKCPVVEGAAIRIPLHYDDPKAADDTPEEEQRYDERCWQIGNDMFQMMALVAASRNTV